MEMYLETRKKKNDETKRAILMGLNVGASIVVANNAVDKKDYKKAKEESARGLDIIDQAIQDDPEVGKWFANYREIRKTLISIYKQASEEEEKEKVKAAPKKNQPVKGRKANP